MERYAPNKMELASRDVVSRAEQTEIHEGRGFPDGTVALDVTVVPRKRIHEALREIVLVGRDFAGVDITREPIHIKPGNHYMMGGVKTDIHGRTSIGGLYAAGEVRLRLGPRRQPPRRQLTARHADLRPPLGRGRRCPRQADAPARPDPGTLAAARARIDEIIGRDRSGRRVAEIRHEMSVEMDRNIGVFREAEGIQTALDTVRRLKEEAKSAYIDDHGAIFNQDLLGAIELDFMLENAECTCVAAPCTAPRAAAPSTAPTSPSETTTSGSSTSPSRRTATSPRSATPR